jgi:hypothetical protein
LNMTKRLAWNSSQYLIEISRPCNSGSES